MEPAAIGARLHWPVGAEAVQLTVPSVTVTVPLGVPELDATVTPIVTGCAGNDGSGVTEVIWVVESAGPSLGSSRSPALQARVKRAGTLVRLVRQGRRVRMGQQPRG